ncbi:type III secretion system effector protein [Xanthomonas phaseoli pv. dieffenbachiae]|uniref:XopV/AopV family type III secretion system effector n=1 Tax=Xanthomonas sp. NCPPB 3569 TaxID=487554 RepID=UPI001237F1B5|nr:XopV/AopV family type III secretion system effector [Xanthomonas phaseoli]MBO9767125.1 type III secretion system effector protein [Xanthomonas phaseoli pv. dieffenbachiae]MBO9775159.1 type III secretion system effector protein [Xanthomonas phaseoli pv. dieffenbachiae]MBO9779470.1 type III secretion system effector protein [Xanthomonas phaseoli pv. dieffenbachiae]MBO9795406.1 type III secretion system effector protein [Xanthomonas phaseoli pv. dieffenbachiae]MBO9799717.1 type III secretion s
MKISGSASGGLHEPIGHGDLPPAPSLCDDIQLRGHTQLHGLPPLRRSASAKARSPAFVADNRHLDALFGSTQPARGKQLEGGVHRTPIQSQEIDTPTASLKGGSQPTPSQSQVEEAPAGGLEEDVQPTPSQSQEIETPAGGQAHVKINPTRLFVSTAPALEMPHRLDPAKLSNDLGLSEDDIDRIRNTPTFHEQNETGAPSSTPLAQRLRLDDLRNKKVEYKWNIAGNGSLVIGEGHPGVVLDEPMTSKQARKKKQPYAQGHVTLVGGQPWDKTPWQENRMLPEARLGGTLYYNPDGELCIDNDSGRFSEYADRTSQHLENVAKLFQYYGLPVTPQWKAKKQIPLQRLPAGAAVMPPRPAEEGEAAHSDPNGD